ncbi:aminotransferase class III-fold pyridoxal phosphate-dependent enzyme [Poriferisphaera sp. WC338]|uniref:aminotransferase class III-fold pyridoxal phosphate-dependent enzyme n=1 Tax=Poriferisphaera sp. WC338 TaxID=3425129 RepID=UPI003D81363B
MSENNTHATNFHNDPRVQQAKALLREALTEHSSKLDNVAPANLSLETSYKSTLESCGQLRGGNLFFPYLGSGLGNGPFVELGDGSVKLDFITGIGVHFFGHSSPILLDSQIDAALADTIMQGNLQQNLDTEILLNKIMKLAKAQGAELEHCFLTSSGSMANDNAFKLAFQKHSPADRVIAFENCFCGRTIAMASVTDKELYRTGIPTVLNVDYIPYFDPENPEESTARSIAALKRLIQRYPNRHALMKFELLQGEGGGYKVAQADYFRELMTICRENNVAVLADEIQTFGRFSKPFAFQYYNLDDLVDLVNIGKLSQVCATLFTSNYKPKPGLISQTFTSSASQINAAITIMDTFANGDLFGPNGKIETLTNYFRTKLQDIADRVPGSLTGPFGLGDMIAFTPLDGSLDKAKALMMQLYDDGLLCFIAGGNPYRLRMLPPIPAIDESHIDLAANLIETAIKKIQSV